MANKTRDNYKMIDYDLRLRQIEDLLIEAKEVFSQLDRAEKKINKKYDYTTHGALRGGFLGNFIRGNRVSAVNSNIDRSQEALLNFHSNLLLFDQRLANKINLPSKMSEFSSANGKASDIAIRTNMRLKGFDVTKSKRSMEAIIRRLESERKKACYEISKRKELEEYLKDKNKGKLK